MYKQCGIKYKYTIHNTRARLLCVCVCVCAPDGGRDTRCDQSASHDWSFVVVVVIVVVVWYTRASPERWSDGWMGGTPHFTSLRFASLRRVESRERTNDRLNPERACVRVCVFVCSCVRARKEKKRRFGRGGSRLVASHLASYILNLKS